MLYKIKNGDVFKILPIIDKNNQIVPFIASRCLLLPKNKSMVYDVEDKIIHRIYVSMDKRGQVAQRYFFSILLNGEIKIISVGKSIHSLVLNNPSSIVLLNNTHLNIVVEIHSGFPDYGKSYFTDEDWKRPFEYTDKTKWVEWLKDGQICLHDMLEKMDIKNHIVKVEDELGRSGGIAKILAEFRDKKLDIILENDQV